MDVRVNEGVVFMELDDFIVHFLEFDVCYYNDSSLYSFVRSIQGTEPTFYEARVSKKGKYTFGFSQINPRVLPLDEQKEYALSRVSVLIVGKDANGLPKYVAGNSSNRMHTFVEMDDVELEAGSYTIVLTTHWKTFVNEGTLSAYGPASVEFKKKTPPTTEKLWQIMHALYLNKSRQPDTSQPDGGFNQIAGIDSAVKYKHQILEDGFGYFHFVNQTEHKTVTFTLNLITMENLELVHPEAIANRKLVVRLPPKTEQVKLYQQTDAPNKIKFQMGIKQEYSEEYKLKYIQTMQTAALQAQPQ